MKLGKLSTLAFGIVMTLSTAMPAEASILRIIRYKTQHHQHHQGEVHHPHHEHHQPHHEVRYYESGGRRNRVRHRRSRSNYRPRSNHHGRRVRHHRGWWGRY